jgi:carboxymethylenebutenolidase
METEYYGVTGGPLVIMVHDSFGRLPSLEGVARSLASEGFQVAVPDLFDGRTASTEEAARELFDASDIGAGLATIDGIIDEARLYGTQRVGTLGFSSGGWLALLHAQGGEVDAVAAYCAGIDKKHHGVIPCPVLLHYSETEFGEYSADAQALWHRLVDHGTPVSRFSYLARSPFFANSGFAAGFEPNAAALALARTAAFFTAHLLD